MPDFDCNTKTCSKCGRDLPLTDFYRSNKSSRAAGNDRKTGKPTNRKTHTKWCSICREERRKLPYGYDPQRVIKRRLLTAYGITELDYAEMLDAQDGLCAICGKPESRIVHGTLRRLSVDHDHTTGKVRGLLCHDCNCGLGRFKEDTESLRKAIEYLEKHK